MEKFVLAIDQSTTGTKALVIDKQGNIVGRQFVEHAQIYAKPGWVEHDPLEIYRNVVWCIQEVLRLTRLEPKQLAVITITNQRETVVVWDSCTGMPVYNAIVWQCDRTADMCQELKRQGNGPLIKEKTGLVLDPYFSASKIRWILDHVSTENNRHNERGSGGNLHVGTIDSWLIWKLTNGKVHATDYSNACRTSLFNIHTLAWDPELLETFGVVGVALPEVKSSNEIYGFTKDLALFSDSIPISGVIGDSQAALFGQLCHQPGMAKATYGTGTSVLMNTGRNITTPDNGLVTTIAWGIDGKVDYALEGIIRSTGDCLKWVKDQLGLFSDYSEAERAADSLADNEGVYLVPAFVGLGAPYWDPYARAAIIGLNRRSGKDHVIRAAMESISYQVRDTVELMQVESGIQLRKLFVDGGATENQFLMQFQADMLQVEVEKPQISELSALGSSFLGGLAVGFWNRVDDLYALAGAKTIYRPLLSKAVSSGYHAGWKMAVQTILQRPNVLS